MKKFLLATAAIFVATSANAEGTMTPTGPYTNAIRNDAHMNLKAELQFASEYQCTDLNFGTITLNANEDLSDVTIELKPDASQPVTNDTVLAVTDFAVADCGSQGIHGNDIFTTVTGYGENGASGNVVKLTNGEKEATVTLDLSAKDEFKVGGSINFQIDDQSYDSLKKWAGDYAASVTFTTIHN